MRRTLSEDPSGVPRARHSLHTTAMGALVATLLVPVLVMAVMYPLVGLGLVAMALAARPGLRALRRVHRSRRRRGRTRRVCVPKTRVCVEV